MEGMGSATAFTTSSLTKEQLARIARNKAAALARLAQARQLAAWASQPASPQPQSQNPQNAYPLNRSDERMPSTNNSVRISAHFASKQKGAQVSSGEAKQCGDVGIKSAPVPLAGQLAVLLGEKEHRSRVGEGLQLPAVQNGVTINPVVGRPTISAGCAFPGGQLQVDSFADVRKQSRCELPATGAQNLLGQGSNGLAITGRGLETGLSECRCALKAEQALRPLDKRWPDIPSVERNHSLASQHGGPQDKGVRSWSASGLSHMAGQSPCPVGTVCTCTTQQALYALPGRSSDQSGVSGAAAIALKVFAAAGNVARTSQATVDPNSKSNIGTKGQSDCRLLLPNTSSLSCGEKLRRESDSAGARIGGNSKAGAQKQVPFLRWPRQVFDYFLVIDFECTCDNRAALEPQEIIEFPSVLLNARTLCIEDSFRVFCRPEVHSQLTPFCTKFTGIRQEQVDAGMGLQDALHAHDTWLRSEKLLDKPARFAVVTWTDWDCKVMLEMECKWKKIQKPAYFNEWINLKLPFVEVFPKAKGTCHRLRGHVTYAGVKWEGQEHSGLDDATNTARLAAALIRQGGLLKITNSFKIYAADGSRIEPKLKKRPLSQADSNAGEGPIERGQDRCYCGVKRKRRTVKKPGPTHGHAFFSCGKWSITAGGSCEYFEWALVAN